MEIVPQNVNSEESSRVKASMVDDLSLGHSQGLRHPIQESEVSPAIEIDKLAHKVARPSSWAGSLPTEVPFGKVDPVIHGLNSQKSKGQKKGYSTNYVDECRDPNIPKSCHSRTQLPETPEWRKRDQKVN